MKKIFFFILALFAFNISNAQSDINLSGMRFEEYTKASDASTILEFKSNTRAIYIMSGVSPFSGRSFQDICQCTAIVNGNRVNIKCNCEDKEVYPDPIIDNFVFDKSHKQLVSTKYQYTDGSAPNRELAWKYIIWRQK